MEQVLHDVLVVRSRISDQIFKPDEVIGHLSLTGLLHVLAIVLDHLGHLILDPPIKKLRVVLVYSIWSLRAVVHLRQIVVPTKYGVKRIPHDNNRSVSHETGWLWWYPWVVTLDDPD